MSPATVGSLAETDRELRIRQRKSVAIPSVTPFEGVDGALAVVAGITRHKLYENDTGSINSMGLPPHSIAAIVDGGDVNQIAQTIRGKKGQGVVTFEYHRNKYAMAHLVSPKNITICNHSSYLL